MRAAGHRLRREHNDRAWLAWHIEALHRTKRLPKLKTMMSLPKEPHRERQSIEQQIAIARMWSAAVSRN